MSNRVPRRFQSAGRGIIAVDEPEREKLPLALAPSLASDTNFNRVRAGLVTVAFVRLEEIHFAFGSSFLLPFDFDAGPLKRIMKRHEGCKLAVYGHADPVGAEGFNKTLSGRRALCVYAMLVRRVDLWQELYTQHDTNGKDDWGAQSVQIMLQRLRHDPGRTDGVVDQPTQSALRDFERANGAPPSGFNAANRVDSATFQLLARAYMDSICVDRSGQRFATEPSVPGSPPPSPPPPEQFVLDKTDFLARGEGKDLKGDVMGCGEFNPIILFSKTEDEEFSREENHADRNRENQPNRRVMILLYRPDTRVDPAQWPCPTYKEGVAGCKKRFFSDAARRIARTDERRLFSATKDTFECRFFQRMHEHAIFQLITSARLDSRFALTQFEGVAKLFARDEFHAWMLVVFGADIPEATLDDVRQQLLDGAFPNCDIALVDGGVDGHDAAYDRSEKLILIDEALALKAEKDNLAAQKLAATLVEEYGHFIDDHLRTEMTNIGGDADLDEGAVFGFAIVNLKNDIQGKMEIAQHTHDGVTVPIIIEYQKMEDATKQFFSEQERIDDARTERFEFFGAGPGGHRSNQQPGASFGHESIEFVLEQAGFSKASDPAVSELKRVYFGNWLRDFSQVIDPKLVRKKGSPASTDGFERASLTKMLDILSREHFSDDPMFEVTEPRCLVYRPEHHIDNPKGLTDETAKDPEFRQAFDPREGEIDPALGLKVHIRSGTSPQKTARDFITQELDAAMSEGRTTEGFRRLGAALHVVEDYYSHSNFVELSLIELGHPNVFPWAGTRINSTDPLLNGKFPIVTGMFGGTDTLVSVLDISGEHLQNAKPCEAGARSTGMKIALILLKDKGQSEMARKLEFVVSKFEQVKKDFPELATLGCRLAEEMFRFIKAILGSLIVQSMDLVAVAQKEFENNPASNDPTHSMLAKDHDNHPLHIMAANMAMIATKDVASAMNDNWLRRANPRDPRAVALSYIVHPALLFQQSKLAPQTPDPVGPLRLWKEMENQAQDGGNQPRIKKVEGPGWMHEQAENARKEQEEIRKRVKDLGDPNRRKEEIEQLIRRIEQLRNPPLPNV